MCCLESVDGEKVNKNFDERLLTFRNWNGPVNPLDLAQAGFYFTQYKDVCKCVCCSVEIFKWDSGDCPIDEHFKHSSYCDFANILWKCKNLKPKKTKTVLAADRVPFLVLIILIFTSLTFLISLPFLH